MPHLTRINVNIRRSQTNNHSIGHSRFANAGLATHHFWVKGYTIPKCHFTVSINFYKVRSSVKFRLTKVGYGLYQK